MGLIGNLDVLAVQNKRTVAFLTDDNHYYLTFSIDDPKDALEEYIKESDIEEDLKQSITQLVLSLYHPFMSDGGDVVSLSQRLPGVKLKVKHPITGELSPLWNVIIDLNDVPQKDKGRNWTREEIADWIENTCALEDIKFPDLEVTSEKGKLSQVTNLVKIQRILQD